MIQLNFDAADAATALLEEPVAVGYSSYEGAERADWGEDKLELVDGTHPSSTRAPALMRTSTRRRSTSAARRRRASAATTRAVPISSSVRTSRRSRATLTRRWRRSRGSPSRGAGRAAAGLLQWPDRAESESSGPSRSPGPRSGETAATRCLPGVCSGRARPILLQRGRQRLDGAHPVAARSHDHASPARCWSRWWSSS